MKTIAAAFLIFSTAASANEVLDCKSAASTGDINECARLNYESTDKKLNSSYSKLIASSKQAKFGLAPEFTQAIVSSQRAWIKFRDESCKVEVMYLPDDVGIQTAIRHDCLARLSLQRTEDLDSWHRSRFD